MAQPAQAAILALLRKHGRNTTSFQVLEPGLSYWIEPAGEACVAYADVGGAWVVAGAPICAAERELAVYEAFLAEARAQNRRVRFFAVESERAADLPLAYLHIGEQPAWEPARWPEIVSGKRSLREQLRRARAKGVRVRRVTGAELADPGSRLRRSLDAMIEDWLESREMAPMGFLVHLDPYGHAAERRIFVAELAGEVVGVLSAVPVYARDGWFFEDVLRDPVAPNGTIELMFDHAMRALADEGATHVTYGLAPLAHTPYRVLRLIRDHTRWLYDFEGLRRFKAKLQPHHWSPVYMAFPRRERGVRAVIDCLKAFARGSFWRFGIATALHRAAAITRLLALLLIPWTVLLALVSTERWFPSREVQLAWIGADVLLFCGLWALASRWRRRLAMLLAAAALTDFVLGTAQAILLDIPRVRGPTEALAIAAALGAPLFAAVFLWAARDRAERYQIALHHELGTHGGTSAGPASR